ncbi:hypothetical protein [Methyloterricola oryzae]|uniref:hypothetical protein n=1 Tax=Methyloterricola oryzae TaxID=1495050 RepID=UPI0005EBEE45|nr:hypothetical protein [Methyloterricola oryzae]
MKTHTPFIGNGIFALILAALALSAGTGARAETLYSTGFEAPVFAAGDVLVNKDGWTGSTVPLPPPTGDVSLNAVAAKVTDRKAKSGSQAIEVLGGELIGLPVFPDPTDFSSSIFFPYDTIGSYRHPIDPPITITSTSGRPFAVVEADMMLDTRRPPTVGEFFSMTLVAKTDIGATLGEMQLTSDGRVWAFNAEDGRGSDPIPTFAKGFSFNKWYHLKVVLDFRQQRTLYFVNDDLLGSVPHGALTTLTGYNSFTRGSFVVQARPDSATNLRANYTARYDNFRISVRSRLAVDD